MDARIRSGRLLTGADLDIESVHKDKNGRLWFGDEFGPFLVKTDAAGKVLRSEVALPGVMLPQNPFLGGATPNLGASRCCEGMAINAAGDTLYTLLEGTVTGDPAKSLRINAFDVDSKQFGAKSWLYHLENDRTNIGDMTALNDHTYPATGGRNLGSDNTEFLKIHLAAAVPEPQTWAPMLAGFGVMASVERRRHGL